MLSDHPIRKNRKSPRVRSPNARKDLHWSDQQKIEAVQTYLMLGSINGVAKVLNIPQPTLQYWKGSEWWKEIQDQLKTQENILLGNRLKGIIEVSLEKVADRLENGDFVYNQKTGEIIRKPVVMKDALKAATDLMDRKQKLTQVEHFTVQQEGIMEKLEKLAKAFEATATKTNIEQTPVIEVTDVIFGKDINAVPKEREAGLQDGIQEVPQQA